MSAPNPWERPLGARPLDDETTEFRVWAPRANSVAVRLRSSSSEDVPLKPVGSGVYEVDVPARAGDDYWFVLDGRRLPDPCSRWQPKGLRGPSRVFGPVGAGPLAPPALSELVIYELHVGTFSDSGTFEGAIPYLRSLAEIGISAIEIMPVAEFPGARGWGYDGVYLSAAQSSYGGPEGMLALVRAAHDAGLVVILDVVYNHVGASGVRALKAYGPYFTDRHKTLWGPAIDFAQPAVREWVLQSATGWIRDFGIDGLRLDAIHAIFDDSDEHIVAELARRVHEVRPDALVIAETGLTDPRDNGGYACDATWVDNFHHALHVLLTGEQDGYYADFGRLSQLADTLAFAPPERIVVFDQNHDQVGNRAFGDRLPMRVRPLAAFCTLLAPFVSLIFMGEEYGETAPFQFFSDHIDKRIAEATREGRREEFAAFAQFGEEIPDPQAVETFERSKLTRQVDPALQRLYGELLSVRHRLPSGTVGPICFDEAERWLRVRRGAFELVCNFAEEPRAVPCEGSRVELATHGEPAITGGRIELQPLTGALIS